MLEGSQASHQAQLEEPRAENRKQNTGRRSAGGFQREKTTSQEETEKPEPPAWLNNGEALAALKEAEPGAEDQKSPVAGGQVIPPSGHRKASNTLLEKVQHEVPDVRCPGPDRQEEQEEEEEEESASLIFSYS